MVLWELEDESEECEEFVDYGVVDVACEALNLGAVGVNYGRVGPLEGRDELGDVVDFRVVEDARGNLLYEVLDTPSIPSLKERLRYVREVVREDQVAYTRYTRHSPDQPGT